MKITGNTVLITGGASGIGLSIAKVFLENMNAVIVCGRNINKLDGVKKQYPGIHTIQCDVSNPIEVTHMLDHLTPNFPSLNILVNNAGIQHRYDFLKDENALKKIDEEIDINFKAVARLTKIVFPNLVKASEAAIINVSSFLGIVPKSSAPIYCATKMAVPIVVFQDRDVIAIANHPFGGWPRLLVAANHPVGRVPRRDPALRRCRPD